MVAGVTGRVSGGMLCRFFLSCFDLGGKAEFLRYFIGDLPPIRLGITGGVLMQSYVSLRLVGQEKKSGLFASFSRRNGRNPGARSGAKNIELFLFLITPGAPGVAFYIIYIFSTRQNCLSLTRHSHRI